MLRILHLIRLISFGTCLASARSHSGENNALCCFLTPSCRFATRCGSVTLGVRQSTGLSFNTLTPLRYPLMEA